MIALREPRPPASAEQLTAARTRLAAAGFAIPPSYAAFLADHDGGVPVAGVFTYREPDGTEHEAEVRLFYGAAPSEYGDLAESAEALSLRLPAGVLPIGEDDAGNLVCLDGRDGRDGPVLFWDHEQEPEPPDGSNLFQVAPDLATFLAGLTEEPPSPPPPRRGRFGRR